MREKTYETPKGSIHYWVSDTESSSPAILFLPGLTADHRLFEKQIELFEPRYRLLVWDAPGHALSRPFSLDISLEDKARWLVEIMELEDIHRPILVGQSMGGYVGQMLLQLFPDALSGYISIDSAPLQRSYMTTVEIWMLKHTRPMYKLYPWKALVRDGARGCSETPYGIDLMKTMMGTYTPEEYVSLVSEGYRMLAEAVEQDLPYEITCPAMLICGEKDRAGSTKAYNKKWARKTGLVLHWIPDAGHNSNTDQPELINRLIETFLKEYPA